MLEMRIDSYDAHNRGISYEHGVQFTVNPIDCSLSEMEIRCRPLPNRRRTSPNCEVKTVDGVKCKVMVVSAPFKGTECTMLGGSFVPSVRAVESGPHGVLLETDVPNIAIRVPVTSSWTPSSTPPCSRPT